MGQLRFATPEPLHIRDEAVQRAYVSGIEGVPWPSENRREGNHLVIQREISESGNLYIPWETPGRGTCVLSTASLMERAEPYLLPVELARGLLNRVRNHASAWQSAGMELPESLHAGLKNATNKFFSAVTAQSDMQQAADLAQQAIAHCLDAIDDLSARSAQKMLEMRKQQSPQLPTLLVGPIDETFDFANDEEAERAFVAAFNTAAMPFTWRRLQPDSQEIDWRSIERRIEWCQRNNLRVVGGPLFRPDRSFLPDWIRLWEDDFEKLQSHVSDHVSGIVQRFRDDVHVWHCAAGTNVRGSLALSDEQSLRLTLAVIESVRTAASKTPIFISVDQPWGEFLAREEFFLSPIHFADALVRGDLGLAGIGLEINMGYWPHATQPRELLEFSQQIDRWSQLGLPLVVLLTAPSEGGEDIEADRQATIGAVSAQSQATFVEGCLELLLAKPAVHAVIWGQLSDEGPHTFAHGGLFDAGGSAKPILQAMAALRAQHLM